MKTKLLNALSLALIAAMLVTSLVLADNVINDVAVDVGFGGKLLTITAGGAGSTVNYHIVGTGGDGELGCNATAASPATVSPTGMPSGVTASPSSRTFSSCGTGAAQGITFAASALTAPGDYPIGVSVSDSGPGSYHTNPGEFTLRVLAPPPPSDTTAPTASPTQSPDPNPSGWNNTDVTVTWDWTDNSGGSGIDFANCTTSSTSSGEGNPITLSASCKDLAGNTGSASYDVKVDKTAPNAPSVHVSPVPNAAGWNNTNVTVTFSSNGDAGSVQSGVIGCSSAVNLTTETAGNDVSGTCTDAADNISSSASATVRIDKTAPSFGSCPAGGPFLLGSGIQSVGPISVDASISGLNAGLSSLSGSVDTSSIGLKTVNFTAVDNADNSAGKACSYSVIYNFIGFLQPVENPGAGPSFVFNRVKAGSAIPVKFSLSGDQGLGIMAEGYPKSENVSCTNSSYIDDLTGTVTAGNSSLSYDPTNDQYNYVWKTDKAWATKCRKLTVRLIDGTDHVAYFMFTK